MSARLAQRLRWSPPHKQNAGYLQHMTHPDARSYVFIDIGSAVRFLASLCPYNRHSIPHHCSAHLTLTEAHGFPKFRHLR